MTVRSAAMARVRPSGRTEREVGERNNGGERERGAAVALLSTRAQCGGGRAGSTATRGCGSGELVRLLQGRKKDDHFAENPRLPISIFWFSLLI